MVYNHCQSLLLKAHPMTRPILNDTNIHSSISSKVANYQSAIVREVQAAVAAHDVVVVGMALNPFPKKARKLLDAAQQPYTYLSYGSYVSQWYQRSALKMWSGWPTFPMVFVKGTLVGGADDLKRLMDSGELKKMLA
jgi:monothiol glutaredoxin